MIPAGIARDRLVFLLDVDNTLIDNDAIIQDLRDKLTAEVGAAREARYWAIFEDCRRQVGYADYLGTLQRYRLEDPHDPNLLTISSFLVNYPFATRLYPGVLDLIRILNGLGRAVILTDGDVVFQPLKIQRSGLFDAVQGRVLLYVHKEQELDDVARRFPADHYVLVDDKIRLLTAIKHVWGPRLTSVFPRQGHYAHAADVSSYLAPDISIERIGDLDPARLWAR
jgi:hypothetical protein